MPLITSLLSFLLLVLNRTRMWFRSEVLRAHRLCDSAHCGCRSCSPGPPVSGAKVSFERLQAGKRQRSRSLPRSSVQAPRGSGDHGQHGSGAPGLPRRAVPGALPRDPAGDVAEDGSGLGWLPSLSNVRQSATGPCFSRSWDWMACFRMLKRFSLLALLLFALLLGLLINGTLPTRQVQDLIRQLLNEYPQRTSRARHSKDSRRTC